MDNHEFLKVEEMLTYTIIVSTTVVLLPSWCRQVWKLILRMKSLTEAKMSNAIYTY